MLFGVVFLEVAAVFAAFHVQGAAGDDRKRYDGYKLFSAVPTDAAALEVLRDIEHNDIYVDFWREPSALNRAVTFMVAPIHQIRVVTKLRRAGIPFTLDMEDVQQLLTPMWNELDGRAENPDTQAFDLNQFNTLDDINAWLAELVTQCRAGLTCELYSVGVSWEGRSINAFRISKADAGRKAYFLDATTHAREWITTSTISNILNALATSDDANAVRLTDTYDWIIVPVTNVDGYNYTWSDDRLWRKNRNPIGACIGVDINRNYDWKWGGDGASNVPCSDTYCGESAGSELETQAISGELQRLAPTLAGMVTYHAYGTMFMFPWGNTVDGLGQTCEHAADHDELMRVADISADAMAGYSGLAWYRGNSCEVMYKTTGMTDDYAKGAVGIKYAFIIELRGDGFVVPPSQIPDSFQEVWVGLNAMVNAIGA